MEKRKPKPASISAASLKLETAPVSVAAKPAQPGAVEVAAPTGDAPAGPVTAPEHADIGNWEAIMWKTRPMWRHRRTGKTLHNRTEVYRNRNLK